MIALKISVLTSTILCCTHALANVQGMNSTQLAAFAQSQNSGSSTSRVVPTYQQQIESNASKIAQANVNQLLSNIQGSYGATNATQGQASFSVKNYNRSVPKVRHEVKVEHKDVAIPEESVNRASEVATKSNVQIVGEPEEPESKSSNWITAVSSYDSDLQKEEERLLANKPKIQQSSQGYVRKNYSGVSVQNVSYSYPSNTYSAGSSVITASPNSRAPVIGSNDFYAFKPASIECVIEAANAYQVPAYVLLGIASQERGKNGQRVRNTDGSYDLGHFQLNTIHFRSDGYFKNIDVNDAKWRGCYNAELAAWLLRKHLLRTDKTSDFWTRVAGYHSWTPSKNAIYRKSVQKYSLDWQAWLAKRNFSAL